MKWVEEERALLSHWVISVLAVTATVIGGNIAISGGKEN
jgi:hypothetical protein